MKGSAALAERLDARPRHATGSDLTDLERFIASYTTDGTLLPRTRADLRRHLRDFLVVEQAGRLVGCGALHLVEPGLGEIRTLAVDPERRGQGLGGALVEGLLREAGRRGLARVFCLTRRVGFFGRLGFQIVDRERYPQKVWNDCRLCPRLTWCDETAMERTVPGL